MDEEFVGDVFGRVMLFDDVVDVGHGGADEESQDECDDVMLMSPEIDVDGVENSQEREAPGDAIDDDLFSGGEELVDDCGEEEKVDKRPYEESPGSGCDVRFFGAKVDPRWGGYGVYI